MIIALDYDKTYTADPILWDDFLGLCLRCGHKIICITMRYPSEPILDLYSDIAIYYTSRKAKLIWAKDNDIHVDIWIDDKPAWLFDSAPDAL